MSGGRGNDELYGGEGNDNLFEDFGNDILFGGGGDDTLQGSALLARPTKEENSSISNLTGETEIDILTGEAGKDTFVLQATALSGFVDLAPLYVNNGNNDYAVITDFNKSDDVIQLARNSGYPTGNPPTTKLLEYSLGESPSGLVEGTGIFVQNLGAQPDLVAILPGIYPDDLSLSEGYFQIIDYSNLV